MMLSKIDSRLLAPEAESLCQMGTHDDSEQNEVAEKDKFEDTLISRSVTSFYKCLNGSST
ncbi:unnamed protein product [Anisakis simplex]|uniref:Ovule protein n=1 Tax=Anisakis simplex TaxID=6269 RepID=A0A0M3JNW5_ANISI|nr:unnamed protein product [Anisakis simplex]